MKMNMILYWSTMMRDRGRGNAAHPRTRAFESAAGGRPSGRGRPALVVFVDRAECRWLKMLRPGFRHCFAVLRDGPLWLACDSLLDRIVLHGLDLPADEDLGRLYAEQGHVVLAGQTEEPTGTPGRPRLAPLTCVTVVKRVLGLRAPAVVTPWQLYRHLTGRLERPFAPVTAHAGPIGETDQRFGS